MRVRIEATGAANGTVLKAEDGADITQNVADVAFRHRLSNPPKMQIALAMMPVQIQGEVTSLIAPNGKRVYRIQYEDGTMEIFGRAPTT